VLRPADPAWGDLTTDVGLVLARRTGRPADVLAAAVARALDDPGGWLASVEVGGPGFLNVRFAPAFWRGLFAEALEAGPAWGRSTVGTGRAARVLLFAGGGATPARALALAEATAGALAACGYAVARAMEKRPTDEDARPWRVAVRGTATHDAVVSVGPVHATPASDRVPADAVRFALLRRAPALPVDLDPGLGAPQGIASPLVAIGYALERIRRLGPPPAAADLEALDAAAAPVLRAAVKLPDAIDAAARLAPHVLAGFAVELAAAFHRYYNRLAAVTDDLEPTAARRALAGGVARALRTALALLGVEVPAGS
jgi:arginyl-tRNA synthetase